MSEVDTSQLRQDIQVAAERDTRPTVYDLIERQTPAIARVFNGDAAMAERFARIATTEIRRNPKLGECNPHSLLGALMVSAQLGLEPGPLGHVYLVPFKREVTWILGYTGVIELARRAGVVGLRATVVWDCDEYVRPWEDERGLHWRLVPGLYDERTERVGVLVAWTDGKTRLALDVPYSRIQRAMSASEAAKRNVGPWSTDTDAMWRKTGIRAARPFLPMVADLSRALDRDEQAAPKDAEVIAGDDTLTADLAASIEAGDDD